MNMDVQYQSEDLSVGRDILISAAMSSTHRLGKVHQVQLLPVPPTNIDDIPDDLLVEILSRVLESDDKCSDVPECKRVSKRWHVHECKQVSKRWHNVVSNRYFVSRYVRLRLFQRQPRNMLIFVPRKKKKCNTLLITTILPNRQKPKEPLIGSFFSFLPCFKDDDHNNNLGDEEDEVQVVGMYNDLILCCATMVNQRDYYICSPFNNWLRLPPTPRVCKLKVPVGFICERSFYCLDNLKDEDAVVKLDAEYRCRVVRILPNSTSDNSDDGDDSGFHVEIFSSETGEWRIYHMLYPQRKFHNFCCSSPGIAYNGRLYWWIRDGFTFELDPFNTTTNGDLVGNCRFIDAPVKGIPMHIGICQGRLRMCPLNFSVKGTASHPVMIWELKGHDQGDGKSEWCLVFDRIYLGRFPDREYWMIRLEQDSLFTTVAFHPNDGEVLYCYHHKRIIIAHLRWKVLYTAVEIEFEPWELSDVYSWVISWWPTPVPKLMQHRSACLD